MPPPPLGAAEGRRPLDSWIAAGADLAADLLRDSHVNTALEKRWRKYAVKLCTVHDWL